MAYFPNLLGIRACIYIHRKIIIITHTYFDFNGNMLIGNCLFHVNLLHDVEGSVSFLLIFAVNSTLPKALQPAVFRSWCAQGSAKQNYALPEVAQLKGLGNPGSSKTMVDPCINNEKEKLNNMTNVHYYNTAIDLGFGS